MTGYTRDMHLMRLELCRRSVEHYRNKTTDLSAGIMFNDISAYTDPERFEAEMQKLFRGMPVVACLSTDLPEAGSYRLFDDTGVPIIIMRGQDKVVRAFLNICRHRGARLLRDSKGCRQRFTCRFHGWTYDTQGRAGRLPQEQHFCNTIDDYKNLIECPAAERYGLVFVQTTPASTMDIDAHLGDFAPMLEKLDLQQHQRICEQDVHADSNWKYTFDTYFENYHFAFLHKQSIGPLFGNDVMLCDSYGPHHRIVYPPRLISEWAKKPESEWLVDTLATSDFVFPNTVIYSGALTPDKNFVNIMRMYPRSVGSLITHVETYGPAHLADDVGYRTEAEQSLEAIVRLVQDEDYDVTGESWKNFLAMPEGSRVVYGRQELAVQHAHEYFAKSIGWPVPHVVPAQSTEAVTNTESLARHTTG